MLEISLIFRVSPETPQAARTRLLGGKLVFQGVLLPVTTGPADLQNIKYLSTDEGIFKKVRMSDCNTVPRSLMAPGKQGPADIYIYISEVRGS